jgi:hypothetical protein
VKNDTSAAKRDRKKNQKKMERTRREREGSVRV